MSTTDDEISGYDREEWISPEEKAILAAEHPGNCETCGHSSDCALHNRPAMAVKTCSCKPAKMAPLEYPGWHRGDWMQTFTGKRFYPLSPKAEDVDPLDIAHALSMLCRYNGHIDRFYSVAEHCVLMARYVRAQTDDNQLALEALLHDGTEAYVGDMIRPLKHTAEMKIFREVEDRVMNAIAERFGLPLDEHGNHRKPDVVQDADTRILLTERSALMPNYHPSDRWKMDGMEPLEVTIEAWSPERAEREYRWELQMLGGLR